MIGSELVQSRVVRTEPELNATATEWREAMRMKGWTEGEVPEVRRNELSGGGGAALQALGRFDGLCSLR